MSERILVIGNKNWSSWSLRPWLAMRVSNIPFREEHVELRQPGTRAACLRHSPSGLVPVLKQDGRAIWDSLAILETLSEQFPDRQLWPDAADARAHARSISAEMHSGFQPLRQHLPMDCLGRYPGRGCDADGVAANIDRVCAIWRECRAQAPAKGPFLFGHFTNADAMFAPVVSRFETYAVPVDTVCRDYMGAILALPAMADWLGGCTPTG